MGVLQEIRALPGAIQELSTTVQTAVRALYELISIQAEAGPAMERLEELERTRAHWEAEMEAILIKADSTLKAASNAESRSRTMLRHAEKLTDPFDPDSEEEPEAVPVRDAPGGEEEGLQPVRVDVAPDYKENALRFKFG